MSELIESTKNNDIKGVERIIKECKNKSILDLQNENGDTALMIACKKRYKEIAYKLIEIGCNFGIKNKVNRTALHLACWADEDIALKLIETVHDLISRSIIDKSILDIQDIYGDTTLLIASKTDNDRVKIRLMEIGCDVNICEYGYDRTALHFIRKETNINVLIKLIEMGCDMNKKDSWGRTKLMHDCMYGHKETVFKLIEAGCDLNIKNNEGGTYKDYAKKYMESTIEKALEARKLYQNLFGDCIKYIKKNRNKFNKKDLMNLNKDIRCYLIKN